MSRKRRRLIARLRSANPRVRVKAMGYLDRFAYDSRLVVQLLIEALGDADGDVRAEAAFALSTAPRPLCEAIAPLIRNLKDPDARARSTAADALGRVAADSPAAIDALIEAISDRSITADVIESLGRIGAGAKKAVPALLKSLEDNVFVCEAAEALGAMGDAARRAVPALCRLLRSSDAAERNAAAKGLAGIGPGAREAVPALLEALQDLAFFQKAQVDSDCLEDGFSADLRGRFPWTPGCLRVAIASALWHIELHPVALPTLVAALGDDAVGARLMALESLGEIDAPVELAPEVAKALKDPVRSVRIAAVEVFARMEPDASVALPVLIDALGDASPTVREDAAAELGLLGVDAVPALDALDRLLTDPEYPRVAAALAVWRISGRQQAISILIDALDDEEPYTSAQAAIALGRIGRPAQAAMRALIAIANVPDKDDYMCRMALRAMERIAGTEGWN